MMLARLKQSPARSGLVRLWLFETLHVRVHYKCVYMSQLLYLHPSLPFPHFSCRAACRMLCMCSRWLQFSAVSWLHSAFRMQLSRTEYLFRVASNFFLMIFFLLSSSLAWLSRFLYFLCSETQSRPALCLFLQPNENQCESKSGLDPLLPIITLQGATLLQIYSGSLFFIFLFLFFFGGGGGFSSLWDPCLSSLSPPPRSFLALSAWFLAIVSSHVC